MRYWATAAWVAAAVLFGPVAAAGSVSDDDQVPDGAVCETFSGHSGHVSESYDFAVFIEFRPPVELLVYTHGLDIFVNPDDYGAGRSGWDRVKMCNFPETTTTTEVPSSTTTSAPPPTTTAPETTTTTTSLPETVTTLPPAPPSTTTPTTAPPDDTTTTEPPPAGGVSAGGGATAVGGSEFAILWLVGGAMALLSSTALIAWRKHSRPE